MFAAGDAVATAGAAADAESASVAASSAASGRTIVLVGDDIGSSWMPGQDGRLRSLELLSMDQSRAALADADLAALVESWIDWAGAASELGVSVASVRTMVRGHQLAQAVPIPGGGARIPADFLQDGAVVRGLPGLLTLLHDGGYDDREAIAWLFTDQDLPGRPIDALRENRGSEVKRRAQAMAL